MGITISVSSVFALFIVLAVLLVVFCKRRDSREAAIEHALKMILCCNSYDKMLDVYTALDKNITEYGIVIQYNYRGFFQ